MFCSNILQASCVFGGSISIEIIKEDDLSFDVFSMDEICEANLTLYTLLYSDGERGSH